MSNMDQLNLVLGGNFTAPPYSMISASGDYQAREYLKIEGKRGRDPILYLVRADRDASNIIFWRDSGGTSQGFAGRTLKFKIVGEILEVPFVGKETFMFEEPQYLELQGPWGSNAHSLFVDTGYDIRDRIKSWGCIGKKRSWDKSNDFGASRTVIEDLVYFDLEPQYGTSQRIKEYAQKMSDEMQETLYYYEETHGGSSCGPVNYEMFKLKDDMNHG